MSDLFAGSIEEAAQLLSSGEVSAVELAESTLDRVDRLDPEIGAFVTRCDRDQVVAEAAASDARRRSGDVLGPLDGIPIGHKDNIATAGLRTTASSLVLEDWIPDHDAAVVTRLRAAGTVLVGKLKNYEFAHSAIDSQHFGRTHNPLDLDRVTGGSSSGSAAALAAGMCLGATGTDTGGSIRIPASFCGVVGLKPTFGLVGRSGVLPSSWSLDHVGPMSRTAGDAALLLSGMVGHDPDDPGSAIGNRWSGPVRLDSLRGVSLGIETTFFNGPTTPGVAAAFQAAASVPDEGPGYGRGEIRSVELTSIERAAARRLGESAAIVPQFELQADVDFEAALELLAGLRAKGINPAPTIGDLIVRITAVTLRGHRRLNGSFKGDRLELYSRINIGFAVSTDRGLLVPTVFDADQTGLLEITRTTADLVDKARAGTLTASQLGGGTFTVSNLGMFGIDRFSALINPPQNAILATGRARKTAVVGADGFVVGRSMMTVTLGGDHRALQGTDGASFLSDFRDLVKDPFPHLA